MKRQIVLESLSACHSTGSKSGKQSVRESWRRSFNAKCRLECPPNGGVLPKAFQHQNCIGVIESRRSHSQHILVVEDESAIRQIYSETLVRSGYQGTPLKTVKPWWNALNAASLDANGYDLSDH